MHILLTVNAAWNIWNFRKGLVAALLADGHEITVLAPPCRTQVYLEEMGCSFVELNMSPASMNPIREAQLIRSFYKKFQSLQPDIVLSFTIKNNIFGALAAKWLAIPFVPNITGLGTAFLGNTMMRSAVESLYRLAFAGLPLVFFQNKDDQNLFHERKLIGLDCSQVLPGSGINLQEFKLAQLPSGKTGTVFLMISRLLQDKGVREFVDAAWRIKAEHGGAEFQILGPEGSHHPGAIPQSDIRSAQANGVITYLGQTDDVRPYIEAAHCVVLPSYREGAPRALIEAAALGRPLIAADVPGSRDVIDSGKTGLLCEVRSGAALAKACAQILTLNEAELAAMGAAGRKKMETEYDEKLIIAAYRTAIADQASTANKRERSQNDAMSSG